MEQNMRMLLSDPTAARQIATSGLETIRARHTCRHRVEELLALIGAHGTERARTQQTFREAAQ
jgi:spore maturation protein CgeB